MSSLTPIQPLWPPCYSVNMTIPGTVMLHGLQPCCSTNQNPVTQLDTQACHLTSLIFWLKCLLPLRSSLTTLTLHLPISNFPTPFPLFIFLHSSYHNMNTTYFIYSSMVSNQNECTFQKKRKFFFHLFSCVLSLEGLEYSIIKYCLMNERIHLTFCIFEISSIYVDIQRQTIQRQTQKEIQLSKCLQFTKDLPNLLNCIYLCFHYESRVYLKGRRNLQFP